MLGDLIGPMKEVGLRTTPRSITTAMDAMDEFTVEREVSSDATNVDK